jgi:hypothetical protein
VRIVHHPTAARRVGTVNGDSSGSCPRLTLVSGHPYSRGFRLVDPLFKGVTADCYFNGIVPCHILHICCTHYLSKPAKPDG